MSKRAISVLGLFAVALWIGLLRIASTAHSEQTEFPHPPVIFHSEVLGGKIVVNECKDLPAQPGMTARVCSVFDGWTGKKWIFLLTGPKPAASDAISRPSGAITDQPAQTDMFGVR